jgi:hypothetical protein
MARLAMSTDFELNRDTPISSSMAFSHSRLEPIRFRRTRSEARMASISRQRSSRATTTPAKCSSTAAGKQKTAWLVLRER